MRGEIDCQAGQPVRLKAESAGSDVTKSSDMISTTSQGILWSTPRFNH